MLFDRLLEKQCHLIRFAKIAAAQPIMVNAPAISHNVTFSSITYLNCSGHDGGDHCICEKQNAERRQDEFGLQQADHQECGGRDQHAQQREYAE